MNGVTGLLLVTPDDNWEAKWNTPAATIPHFTESHTVAIGNRLHILTFVGNPSISADGKADVTCDFTMQKPDGTFSIQKQDLPCLTGPLIGHTGTIYLTKLVIGFLAEKTDPTGTWAVRVTIKDLLKPAVIPLETKFVVK